MFIEILSLFTFWSQFKEYNKVIDSLQRLSKIARNRFESEPSDLFLKAFLVTSNRILLDAKAIEVLVRKGLYGPAWTLHAASLRTRTTIAAIHVRPEMSKDFDEEGKWTHNDEKEFAINFSENNLKKIVSEHFGDKYEKKNSFKEIEQILHGSSYALKRWYSEIVGDIPFRTPVLTFEPFFSEKLPPAILKTMGAIVTEMIGIYFDHYGIETYPPNIICSCGSGKEYIYCHGYNRKTQ